MIFSTKASSNFVAGIFICLTGAICFSTKAIFVKLAYRDTAVDAVTLLTLRMLFSLPFFFISAFVYSNKSTNIKFNLKQWAGVAFIGCLGYYVSSLFDFLGLQYVTAGIERLILFIYPTLVLLMSSVFFKEQVKRRQWIAVLITYTGLALAFFSEVDIEHAQSQNFYVGSALIFICAITYALYIVGSGRLIPAIGSAKFNSYAMSFACVAILMHFSLCGEGSILNLSTQVYIYSFLMAIFSTVVPSYLVTAAIKRIGADNAAIVGSVGPVSTIAQAYFFLDEPVLATQVVGTILILFGVLLIGKK